MSARVSLTEHDGRLFLADPLFHNDLALGMRRRTDDDAVMPFHASSLELLTRVSPVTAGALLDVGCGSGCLTLLLARDRDGALTPNKNDRSRGGR